MPRSSTRRSHRPAESPRSAQAPRVALFVDGPDWHTRRLRISLAERGATVTVLSLRDCGFDTTLRDGLRIPEFEDALPEGAFVRSISAGTFEQVTLRLGILHALTALGVHVYNGARPIECCVDKSTTSFSLQRAGVPTPPTWTVESRADALDIVRAEARPDRPLVLKPLFGSQGRGLRLVEDVAALPPEAEVAGVYYLQRYVGRRARGWHDWRVFVVGGRAVAAMIRHGVEWRTNAARGARCEAVEADGEVARLAVAAAQSVGVSYAGVDVIADERGQLVVLEVNSMPAWKSLQQVSAADIAGALANDFLARIPRAPLHAVASR